MWKAFSPFSARRVALSIALLAGAVILGLVVNLHYPIRDWLFFRYVRVIAFATVFVVACLAAGHAVVVRALRRTLPLAEHVAVAFPIGVFCFFLVAVVFGFAKLYGAPFFFLAPVVLLVLGGASSWRTLSRLRRHVAARTFARGSSPVATAATLFGLAGVGVLWLTILTPENASYDARWYHLPIAEHYVAAGGVVPFQEGWVDGALPHLASYLYVWAFSMPGAGLFDRIELAAHLELAVFLGTLAAIPPLAARVLGEARAPLAWTALFLFPGIFSYDSGLVLGADHIAALFAIPTFLLLLRAWNDPSPALCLLLAIPLAGVLNTKLTAAMLVPFPVLAMLLRGGVLSVRRGSWRALGGPALMVSAIVALTSPYWATNALFYGDPLFPLLRHHLPGTQWSPLAEAPHVAEFSLFRPAFGARGLLEMVSTLATFSFVPHDFAQYHGKIPVFGSLFTLATPALFFLGRRRRLWALFAAAYAAIACWFWIHQLDRYLQVLVPYMAACVAAVMTLAWREGHLVRAAVCVLVGLQIVWGADVAIMETHQTGGGVELKTVIDLLGNGARRDRSARLRTYRPLSDVAAALPRGAKVLLHESDIHAGLGVETAVDFPGFQGAFYYGGPGASSPRDLWELFRRHRITHVLWYPGRDDGIGSLAGALVFHDFATRHLTRLGEFPPFSLGALRDTPPPEAPPALVAYYPCPGGDPRGLYELSALLSAPNAAVRVTPRPIEEGPLARTIVRARYVVLDEACTPRLDDVTLADLEQLAVRGKLKLLARR